MKFCLNVQDGSGDLNWRLQKDLTWLFCEHRANISDNDFTTDDRQVIKDLQVRNLVFVGDGKKYVCHPDNETSRKAFADEVGYIVFAFLEECPKPPSIEQLKHVLLERDISTDNLLLLKTDGLFHVVTLADWKEETTHATTDTVCRLAFLPIGKRRELFIECPLFFNRRTLNYTFKVALHSWRNFMKNKILLDDIDFYDQVKLDDVQSVYAELKEMELEFA